MSDVFQSIGGLFNPGGAMSSTGSIGKILPTALAGFGTLSNFLQGRKQNSYNQSIIDQQKANQAILNDPAAMAAKIAEFRRPLNQGLVSGVGNAVQGSVAERGLAASPSAFEQVMAQALGPEVNQNENSALEAALKSLQIPYSYGTQRPQYPSPVNMTSLLQSLLKKPGTATATPGAATSTPSTFDPNASQIYGGNNPFAGESPDSGAGTGDGFDWSSLWAMVPQGAGVGAGG